MIKKIFKRIFVVLFLLFVVFYLAIITDLNESVAWNIGKFVFVAFLIARSIISDIQRKGRICAVIQV